MKQFIVSLLLIITYVCLQSCSGISVINKVDYNPKFLKRINGIKEIYKNGDELGALRRLDAMDDKKLIPAELAMKYNLVGVIYFSRPDYGEAISNFKIAHDAETPDREVQAKISLNLTSTYFKISDVTNGFKYSSDIDHQFLSNKDQKKHFQLRYIFASQLDKKKVVVDSLINLLKDKKKFREFENSEFRDPLIENFRGLSATERVRVIEDDEFENLVIMAYLARSEVFQRYYMGDKEGAKEVLDWLSDHFAKNSEIKDFIKDFELRIDNVSKIDMGAIGIILPLTGDKAGFGNKVLNGIDTAINSKASNKKDKLVNLFVKDSKNNEYVAANAINDLIQKHHVSLIIGGLYSSTAKAEYLEARKHGVLFISLSPIYLDKEFKNHLLIEITGSVQSQLEVLLSEDVLNKFGRKVAMFYPDSDNGQFYMNEMWRRAKDKNLELTSIQSYKKNVKEYLDPVKKLLGLKYKKERLEEYNIWKELYSLEKKKSSIRRIQILSPVVDFDWVFIPSYPDEAIQILPAFKYFDAKKITFVGGPSWLSGKLLREQKNLGKMYFVGDDPSDMSTSFMDRYKLRYNKRPRLIETLSYEAAKVGLAIVSQDDIVKRDDLEYKLIQAKKIRGITGVWNLVEGIWIKEMDFLKIRGGHINKVDLTIPEETEKDVVKEEI